MGLGFFFFFLVVISLNFPSLLSSSPSYCFYDLDLFEMILLIDYPVF